MDNSPLVSFLIPIYNNGSYIKETVDSIVNQTYDNWECIIVDDHSTDNSWKIINKIFMDDSRIRIFKRPNNRRKGGNAARNFAFEKSHGCFINWLDSDDIISKEFLSEKLKVFENDSKLDFVCSDIREFSDDLLNAKVMEIVDLKNIPDDLPFKYITGGFWIQTGMPLFKRSFLNKYKKHFDEELLMGQEAEFFVRLLLDNPIFKFSSSSVLYYRRFHHSYMTSFYKLGFSEKYKLTYPSFKKHFLEFLRKERLSSEVYEFFRNVFNDMLLFLPVFSKEFWDLFFFGNRYNLFKGRFQGYRILGIRILKAVKLI